MPFLDSILRLLAVLRGTCWRLLLCESHILVNDVTDPAVCFQRCSEISPHDRLIQMLLHLIHLKVYW